MVEHLESLLAEAAQALLAGRPQEARTRYEACATETPHLAALGLMITAWIQGDYRALGAAVDRALAGREDDEAFPRGFAWALEGLSMIHAGAIRQGLDRQSAGLEEARRQGEGAELNAAIAIASGLLYLGRWPEARQTIAGMRPLVDAEAPLASAMIERLSLALAVLAGAPEAGEAAQAAIRTARVRQDDAGLAWALRWHGAWLGADRPGEAAVALEEALVLANRSGQHLIAAEALTALAALGPVSARSERHAAALMHARASGSVLAEIDAALPQGGEVAEEAARRLEALLAPLGPDERSAMLRWPGRAAPGGPPAVAVASLERLGGMLTAIAAQPDLPRVLQAALAAFVEVAGAERGFLLRLAGFEVIDQVVVGAGPDAYSTSLASRVMWTGEPLVIEDLESDADLGQAGSIQEMRLRMALGMPLLSEGEVVGVMLADSREAHPGFSLEALTLARAIADHAVVAWQQAERTERERASAVAEAALARAALAAARAATLEEALPAIAAEAATSLGADRLFVFTGAELVRRAAVDAAGQPLEDERPSMGAVQWVRENGQSLVVVDAQQEEILSGRSSVRELSLRAIHAAPIAHPAGVLYTDSRDASAERPEARRLLAGLAEIVGAVLAREGA